MDNLFTIGKLAREAGVGTQTVRYYERRALLSPVRRTEAGYRLYDAGALKRLRFILHAKEMGFTLKEIGELLELSLGDRADCNKARVRAEAKLKNVKERIESLESVAGVLGELITACDERKPREKCPILKTMKNDHKSSKKGKGRESS